MIAQARITSDTRASVHLATETIELHGANLSEVRSRVKQVFINASRRGGEPLDVVIVEADARHHLRVEPTGRIASRPSDERPLFGPAVDPVPTTSAPSATEQDDAEDLEATVMRPVTAPSGPADGSSDREDPEDTDTAERAAVAEEDDLDAPTRLMQASDHSADPGDADASTPEAPEDHGMADLDHTIVGGGRHSAASAAESPAPTIPAAHPGASFPDAQGDVVPDSSREESAPDGNPSGEGLVAGSPWAPIAPGSGSASLPARSADPVPSDASAPEASARDSASMAPHVAASANMWEPAHSASDPEDSPTMPLQPVAPASSDHGVPEHSDGGAPGRRRAAIADPSPESTVSASTPARAPEQPAPTGYPAPAAPAAPYSAPQPSRSDAPQPPYGGPPHGAPAPGLPATNASAPGSTAPAIPGRGPIAPQGPGHHPGAPPQNVPGPPAHQGATSASAGAAPAGRPTLQDLQAATARPTTAPPTRGWQGFLHRATGGAISPSPGRLESIQRENTARVRKNLDGPKNIAVVNLKGGAHKTTASLMIAATLGVARGGSVLAWDNNETRGTLGWRGVGSDHHRTAVDLLHNLDHLRSATATVADLDGYVRPQGTTRFDILASDEDPGSAALIDGDSFDDLNETLSRFYRLKVIDTGNNVRASNWLAAVRNADQLVIVSTVREDTFNAAAWMIDELRASGLAEQVDHAVTVLSHSSKGKVDPVLRTRLVNHFGAHTRAVTEVPFEPQFVDGSPLNWDRITPQTKDAWLSATAQMIDGL